MAALLLNSTLLSAKASVASGVTSRVAKRAAKRAAFAVRASDDDDVMGQIGLGDLEDIMDKADGGASVPKFIEGLGIEPLTEAFKFLGSDKMTGPGSEALFVEKYGETLYREAGFTPMAELINGRLAQVGFVLAVQNTFNGDVLEMIAKYPLLVFLVVAAITGASLVPTANPQGYMPDGLKDGVMKAYEGAGAGEIFNAKAEMINGRAAMVGMAVFLATATIF
ncbi:uncharacterized protein MICPUCDRAFT_45567 [Micromonas pusilla CCMP1545]|jgi:hypothetical protein|uniref:Predicted protein n=1 Tax=Micromonas pusilla (strain CCMP1545) TaxID=564608 RepID=C1MS80_MICPC|nr:uncharacterized protein MICPUCDRAFT_45567 [Micromonas pusilla CCMP1545]EEH57092.1 predicted protein [Micromonas pusilla CCMP1545]|tara:strand:+ start:371 stop:1039 length:669 start_codon:yes stop_codon:yes gene_type:complete|eukprot:XP_003058637.1 predicted protein [Micromonas pusilla CCMP1545]